MFKFTTKSIYAAALIALFAGAAVAAAPEKPEIRLAVGSSILGYAPVPLTQNLGFLKEEGLTVTVENFQAGGSKALQALIGGSVDIVVGSYDHTIQMQAKGKEIVGILLLNEVPGIVLAVRPDLADKVKTGKDLKGLKVGVTTPGSSTDMIARFYIAKGGLTDRDVQVLSVGSGAPGMVALEARNIDALFAYDPVASQLVRKGSARLVFDARTTDGSKMAFGGTYPFACVYVTRDFMEKNPETVQRVANAFLKTLRWIAAAAPKKIVDTLPATSKLGDAELNEAIWTSSKDMFSKTGLFDAESVKTPLSVLSSNDQSVAKAKINLSRTYTNRFAEEAARRAK